MNDKSLIITDPNDNDESMKAAEDKCREHAYTPADPISYIRYSSTPAFAAQAIAELILYNAKEIGKTQILWEHDCVNLFKLALLYVSCASGYAAKDGSGKRNMREVYNFLYDPDAAVIIEIAMANKESTKNKELLYEPYTRWQAHRQKEEVKNILLTKLSPIINNCY